MAQALQPAVQPALSAGQDNGVQQVGSEGRDKSDVGVPYTDPNWGEGPLLQSPVPSGNAGAIETSGLEHLDYSGEPVDHTPWPDYDGDPDRPADMDANPIAMGGHDWDQGAPAQNRFTGNPDIGKPVMLHYTMQSTEQQPLFSPNGQMIEPEGSRTANVLNWYNDQDINVGIGYYMEEAERPLYIQVAQVPAEYDAGGGLYQPDGRYSDLYYNDGGIPNAYVTPPDPPVSQTPAQAPAVDGGYEYVGNL